MSNPPLSDLPPFKAGPLPALKPHHFGRFPCENFEFELVGGLNHGVEARHPVTVSVAWDLKGQTRELVIEGRGKIGHGIDLLLHDLSIKVSRILQRRDPETGDDLEG